jgi:hypothetical protein
MVAEENYPGTKLGKRLKRLGVHRILIEGMEVETRLQTGLVEDRGVKLQKNVNGEGFEWREIRKQGKYWR